MIYHIFSLALIARETAPAAATKVKNEKTGNYFFQNGFNVGKQFPV